MTVSRKEFQRSSEVTRSLPSSPKRLAVVPPKPQSPGKFFLFVIMQSVDIWNGGFLCLQYKTEVLEIEQFDSHTGAENY